MVLFCYLHTCACMYMYMHVHIHACTYMDTCTCMDKHTHAYTHTGAQLYPHTHTHTAIPEPIRELRKEQSMYRSKKRAINKGGAREDQVSVTSSYNELHQVIININSIAG